MANNTANLSRQMAQLASRVNLETRLSLIEVMNGVTSFDDLPEKYQRWYNDPDTIPEANLSYAAKMARKTKE